MEKGKDTLMNYMRPQFFDSVTQATLLCSMNMMDDEEELSRPSNAIKLGFEVKRIVAAKKGFTIKSGEQAMRDECRDFLELMDSEWSLKVTKIAQMALRERRYNIVKTLPEPKDLKRLSDHIYKELALVDLEENSSATRKRVAQLVEAILISYNRRRSGEIQALK